MILKLNILLITAVAAWMDIRWWKVKNQWIFLCLVGGILYRIFCPDIRGFADGILGMLLPFLILIVFFAIGKIGAADVKLFCVIGLWTGSGTILHFMLFSMLTVAAYFLILLMICRQVRPVLKKRLHVAVFAFISSLCFIGGVFS